MDSPRGVKILVLVLGFLATSSGRHMRVANAGYNYNHGQEANSLNKILKAVLVHESTGHGLHPGSVSSSSRSGGVDLKVMKQTGQRMNSGYSYPASQQMKGNIGATDITTIRVFHESTGNTGNIMRNYSPPYAQQSQAGSSGGFLKPSPKPSQSLRYIHETALARSRSDQQSADRSQGQSASGQIAFPTNSGNAGYQYKSSVQSGNTDNFYGTPRQAGTSSDYRNGNLFKTGPQNRENENVRNFGGNSLQAAISSLAQSVNRRDPESRSTQSASDGYQYPNQGLMGNSGSGSAGYQYTGPIQGLNRNTAGNKFQSSLNQATNMNLRNTQSGSTQGAPNGYQYSGQAVMANSIGYQYQAPVRAVNVNTKGSPLQSAILSLSQAQNMNLRDTVSGAGQVESNGYQYQSQAGKSESGFNGYQYPGPIQALNKNTAGPSLQPEISSLSQVEHMNQRNTASGSGQAEWKDYQYSGGVVAPNSGSVSNGYQYPGQIQAENLGNAFSSSSQAQNVNTAAGPATVQTAFSGYEYPNQLRDSPNSQAENSGKVTNDGYRYESPRSMGNQGEAEQIAISQYSSSFQRNSVNQGYRYDNPGLLQNAGPQNSDEYADKSVDGGRHIGYQDSQSNQNQFAGPPQLQQPGYNHDDSTQTLGRNYDPPKDSGLQHDAYRYNKPEQPASAKSVFKGQPYLPLPPTVKDSGYQYESPKSTQSDGYRYDKPDESSRPQTTFKGQSYLPLPPVSGGW